MKTKLTKNKNTKARRTAKAVGSGPLVRHFECQPEQGLAALLVGTKAEGKQLVSLERRGNRAVAIYA